MGSKLCRLCCAYGLFSLNQAEQQAISSVCVMDCTTGMNIICCITYIIPEDKIGFQLCLLMIHICMSRNGQNLKGSKLMSMTLCLEMKQITLKLCTIQCINHCVKNIPLFCTWSSWILCTKMLFLFILSILQQAGKSDKISSKKEEKDVYYWLQPVFCCCGAGLRGRGWKKSVKMIWKKKERRVLMPSQHS